GDAGDDVVGLGALIVFVQRHAAALDAVMVEQAGRHSRVFTKDYRGGGQGFERPYGDVAQVADRRGDDIEAGRKRGSGEGGAGDEIALRSVGHAFTWVENWLSNCCQVLTD